MSSWRFGDVQHSLSLSCDFILRLPLWGLSALRGSFSLRSLAAAVVEQVRWNLGAVECVPYNETPLNLASLQMLTIGRSQTVFFSPLLFHPGHALFCQFKDQSGGEAELQAASV